MRALSTIIAVMCIALPGFAQSGPAQLPVDGGNNTLFPILERPENGWPDRNEWPSWSEHCAPGLPANFRISKISGDRSLYDAAQVSHQRWYEAYGYTDSKIIPLPVLLPDLDQGVISLQEEIAISITVLGDANETPISMLRQQNEEAADKWTNFVRGYSENSEVIESAWTCVSRDIVQSLNEE